MKLSRFVALGLLLALLFARGVGAGTEVMEIDPLADKDLYSFKVEGPGEWKLDDTTDDVHTLIVCDKSKEDTGLRFIKRTFKNGFRFTMDVTGGSKYKGLEFWIVPPEGDRIQVPFSKRWIARKGWHEFVVTLEKGTAYAQVDDEKGDPIDVPEGPEYTFAIVLNKRSEAMFRRPSIKFLVVSEVQAEPEAGFVRLFDGKTDEGWITAPEEFKGTFKVGDQRIEGKFKEGPRQYANFVYRDGVFRDYILKFKASADTRGLHLVAGPNQIPAIHDYFDLGRDWNEVEWESKAQHVTLKINGTQKWETRLEQPVNVSPAFLLYPGGQCTIRDVMVKGQNIQPGASWARYAAESGVAGGGQFGGRGNGGEQHPAGDGGSTPASRELFNGTDLVDWQPRPSGAWSVEDSKIIGMTMGQETEAQILYGKLVFTDYKLVFKVQQGTAGALFIARVVPEQVAKKPPVVLELKDEWMNEKQWNEFEAVCRDDKLTLKVNGKEVFSGPIHKEQGFLGFAIKKNSAVGIKDIVWHRPTGR
jgi:hypothetical protein